MWKMIGRAAMNVVLPENTHFFIHGLFQLVDRSAGQGFRADHARLSDRAACRVLRRLVHLHVQILNRIVDGGVFADGHTSFPPEGEISAAP